MHHTHEIKMVKSPKQILYPIVKGLIDKRVELGDNRNISMLELMDASAIRDLLTGAIIQFVEDVSWKDKPKSKRKFPQPLIKNVKYIRYIFDNAMRPNTDKTETELTDDDKMNMYEKLSYDAQQDLLRYCYDLVMQCEEVTMKVR